MTTSIEKINGNTLPQPAQATLLSNNEVTDEQEIAVGSHVLHFGGQIDGFCSSHCSYDCRLTKAERWALQDV